MKRIQNWLFSKKSQAFTETPQPGGVGEDYFHRMMSPEAALLARPYDREEIVQIKSLLAELPNCAQMNFVVVGAGQLWYMPTTFKKVAHYIAIEPLGKLFVTKQFRFLIKQFDTITLLEKKFQDVEPLDIPEGSSVYAFIFNILAYIDHPIKNINRLLKKGDVLFITSWSNRDEAKKVRRKYFNYLNQFEDEVVIDPEKTIGLCHLELFPFDKLTHYQSHKLLHGVITDTLIIYT